LLKALDEFEATPESRGYDLRLSLSTLVAKRLKAKGWTQKQLADATGMKESFITRIVHADSNCTFDVAGRILFALGVAAEFKEAGPAVRLSRAGHRARQRVSKA
jgi:transcriptional regulator with XRE-family HTH domain